MAVKYGECKAINLNYIPPPSQFPSTEGLTDVEIKNAEKAKVFASDGRAYGVLHGTRPGTAGIIMQSSPIALLAWRASHFASPDSAAG